AGDEFFETGGADQEVVETVAVDVAGGIDGIAAPVERAADEDESVGAVQRRELDSGGETSGLAEDDVAFPRLFASGRIGILGTDEEIVEPIAVDVARRTDRIAA